MKKIDIDEVSPNKLRLWALGVNFFVWIVLLIIAYIFCH